jgi:hypothetical protein
MINQVLYNKIMNIIEKNGVKGCITLFEGCDIISKVCGWTMDELFNKYFNECHPDYLFEVIRYEKSKYEIIYVWNYDGDIIFRIRETTLELSDDVVVDLIDVFGDEWSKLCINWFNREYETMLKDVYGDDWNITDVV